MAHIQLPEGLAGIVGPLAFGPDTAKPLLKLAETHLRSPNTLTAAEREMIAAHVSCRNECDFCQSSNGAVAAAHLNGNCNVAEQIRTNPETGDVSGKLKVLLTIASKIQQSGKQITSRDVVHARSKGATNKEILDTVLTAAAVSMDNRGFDRLAVWARTDPEIYRQDAQRLADNGYGVSTARPVGA